MKTRKSSRKVENTTSTDGADKKALESETIQLATKTRTTRQKQATVAPPTQETRPQDIIPEITGKPTAQNKRGGRNTKTQTVDPVEEVVEAPTSKPAFPSRAGTKRGLLVAEPEADEEAAEELEITEKSPLKRRRTVAKGNLESSSPLRTLITNYFVSSS